MDGSFEEEFNEEQVAIDIVQHDKVMDIVRETMEKNPYPDKLQDFTNCDTYPWSWWRGVEEECAQWTKERGKTWSW